MTPMRLRVHDPDDEVAGPTQDTAQPPTGPQLTRAAAVLLALARQA
jgi:hypothetical protein